MITCEELDKFVDRLCDLTVDMDPLTRAQQITELLDGRVDQVPRQFLMQLRAAAVADLHYLDGVPLRQIGTPGAVGRSFQGVSQWLQEYGPTHYLSLIKDRAGTIRPALFAVTSSEETRQLIRQYRGTGRRIVPAAMNVADPGSPTGMRAGIDPAEIWDRLEPKPD